MVLRQVEARPNRNMLQPFPDIKISQGSSFDWLWGWPPEKPPQQARSASVNPRYFVVMLIAGGVSAGVLPRAGLRNAQ